MHGVPAPHRVGMPDPITSDRPDTVVGIGPDDGDPHREGRGVLHAPGTSVSRLALSATLHCLTGCAIGEVLGLVIGTALGWGDLATIALAVALAFVFGYSLTLRPLVASGVAFAQAARLALAADTVSIAVMEVVDNAVILAIPDAMDAGLNSVLFWGSLAF